ncbi:MAG: aminotransferase class V-fold PLP-dependent enzyme [Planctomycetota bacterium]
MTRRPPPSPLVAHFGLDPAITFLNHGSFGACPARVLDAQRRHRDLMEREPVLFFMKTAFELMDRSREAVAGLIGGAPEDFVFINNATIAVATIFENLAAGIGLDGGRPLGPGDEILVTNLEYPACLANAHRTAERTGARVRSVDVPRLEGTMTPERFIGLLLAGVTDRTRVCLLSHILSPTGWLLPAAEIIRTLEQRGITTILDGAHGPGCVPIDLNDIRPAFYTTNAHKWLCAPKGSAVLYIRPDLQDRFRPQTLSVYHAAPDRALDRSRYNRDFDYVGTDDVSAKLAIADAIRLVPEAVGMPWRDIIAHNHALAIEGRDLLQDRLGAPPCATDDMVGPMAMIALPEMPARHRDRLEARPKVFMDALQDALWYNHSVQVPVYPMGQGRRYIRISAQVYNTIDQYAYLAGALLDELEREAQVSP